MIIIISILFFKIKFKNELIDSREKTIFGYQSILNNVVKSNSELTLRLSKNIESAQEKSQKGVQLISHVDGIFNEINQGMSGIVEVVKRL